MGLFYNLPYLHLQAPQEVLAAQALPGRKEVGHIRRTQAKAVGVPGTNLLWSLWGQLFLQLQEVQPGPAEMMETS